jgi:hypothetical protein
MGNNISTTHEDPYLDPRIREMNNLHISESINSNASKIRLLLSRRKLDGKKRYLPSSRNQLKSKPTHANYHLILLCLLLGIRYKRHNPVIRTLTHVQLETRQKRSSCCQNTSRTNIAQNYWQHANK